MQRDVQVARYVVIVEQQFVDGSDPRIVHESTDNPFADRIPVAAQLGRIAGAVAQVHEAAAGKSRTKKGASDRWQEYGIQTDENENDYDYEYELRAPIIWTEERTRRSPRLEPVTR